MQAMLRGLMMDYPLTLTHFLERARTFFPRQQIVSRLPDGTLHRIAYADWYARVCRVANALTRAGVRPGDRVASLCWNHYRHLELYFAVPCIGAVLHTLNLRLHPSELGYIAQHAGDRFLIVDRSLLPLLAGFRDGLSTLEKVIVVPDDGPTPPGELDYEAWISDEPTSFSFPELDERSAALMCYTSGTTGNPKGVLYTHRSTTLHTLALCMVDTKGVCEADSILTLVPMFHANAWGLPFAALAVGAKLIFPGPDLSPETVLELMSRERATLAAAVPTIWLGVLSLLDDHPGRWDLSSMRLIAIGGAAAPPALIDGLRNKHGIGVVHAWGMTETNPLATVARLKHAFGDDLAPDAELALRAKQGFAVPFVEQRHVGDDGERLAWDGTTMGELEVRGPWVASAYYENPDAADRFTSDGWFKTGDVVTIDAEGYVQITDRAKDVIKSGGEWISTQALENALMSHPAVLEAAVFAAEHPKWGERPLAAVVLKPGRSADKAELVAHLDGKFAKWWLPEDVLFLEEIPRTSTGKFKKRELRERYGRRLVER
jgi:fatty-acyl-CoA synthase